MSAYGLGRLIETYLEADDDGSSGSNGSSAGSAAAMSGSGGSTIDAAADIATRQQLRRLAQVTDSLSKDNKRLSRELDTLKSNIQISAILPLLMSQQLTIVQDLQYGAAVPVTGNGSTFTPSVGDVLTFAQSDMTMALLPALMMGGDGGGGSGGSNMALVMAAIVLSQQPAGGAASSNSLMLPLLMFAMMGQNQSSSSDSSSD